MRPINSPGALDARRTAEKRSRSVPSAMTRHSWHLVRAGECIQLTVLFKRRGFSFLRVSEASGTVFSQKGNIMTPNLGNGRPSRLHHPLPRASPLLRPRRCLEDAYGEFKTRGYRDRSEDDLLNVWVETPRRALTFPALWYLGFYE